MSEEIIFLDERLSRISQQRLKALVRYEPETGSFYRISGKRANEDVPAGYLTNKGYLMLTMDGWSYPLHRMAWLYTHGEHPNGEIDHIDGNKSNNRIENLRVVTRGENQQNVRKPRKHNKSGFLGVVVVYGGKFQASISIKGVKKHLGVFDTAEDAHKAYLAAKLEFHPFAEIAKK